MVFGMVQIGGITAFAAGSDADISSSFTDVNFKQAIWEWLGNPVSSAPGSFTKANLSAAAAKHGYYLDIAGKNISSLNGIENFEGIRMDAIHAPNNSLTSLPTLPSSLKFLYLANNSLTSLPELPAGLETLDCGSNKLTSLPALPAGLTYLNCSMNGLTALPSLSGLNGLENIYCDDNALTSLPALPNHLKQLITFNNYLTALPSLPDTLVYLSVESNHLKSLPALPSGLQDLGCNYNWLTDLPDLPVGLSYMDCTYNYLNVWSGDLQTKIANCNAATKRSVPQRRLMYTGENITLNLKSAPTAQLSEDTLQRQTSSDGNTWVNNYKGSFSVVTLESSDPSVAKVDSTGLITAVAKGTCTIYARYGGIDNNYTKTAISVTVKLPEISSFDALPSGTAAQNVANGTALADLNLPTSLNATVNGKAETISGVTWTSSPAYNPTTADTYTFTPVLPAGYELGSEAQKPKITVTVNQKTVLAITIKSLPSKTDYKVNQSLDLTGAMITVNYNNGMTEDISVTSSMISGYDSTKTGTQNVTVTYGGASATFAVTVTKNALPDMITDSETKVTYDLSNVVLPSDVTAVSVCDSVLPQTGAGGAAYAAVTQFVNGNYSLGTLKSFAVYDLKLLDQNGNSIEPKGGKIKVKIPIPSGMSGDLKVFWYNPANGTLTDMNATQKDGYLIFETSHFSEYAVAQLAPASSGTTPNPKTGGNNAPILPFALLGAGSAAGFVVIKKRARFKMAKNSHQE